MNTQWWSYSPDEGYCTWDTEALAHADCERTIGYYREKAATEGWDDDVTAIACGPYVAAAVVVEVAHQSGHDLCNPCSADCEIPPGFDSWCDYGLRDVTITVPDDTWETEAARLAAENANLRALADLLQGEAGRERAAVLAWLRYGSDPRARGSSAWEASVGDVLREAASEIERGDHRRTP